MQTTEDIVVRIQNESGLPVERIARQLGELLIERFTTHSFSQPLPHPFDNDRVTCKGITLGGWLRAVGDSRECDWDDDFDYSYLTHYRRYRPGTFEADPALSEMLDNLASPKMRMFGTDEQTMQYLYEAVAGALRGAGWKFCFGGGAWHFGPIDSSTTIRPRKKPNGFQLIHYLLSHPNAAISARDLYRRFVPPVPELVEKIETDVDAADVGDGGLPGRIYEARIDERTVAELRSRLQSIDAEIREVLGSDDFPLEVESRIEELRDEKEQIEGYLRANIGLKGKIRSIDSDDERIRKNVTNMIQRAIQRVAQSQPAIAAHLRDHIRTGTELMYQLSTANPGWILSQSE